MLKVEFLGGGFLLYLPNFVFLKTKNFCHKTGYIPGLFSGGQNLLLCKFLLLC